MKITVKFDDAKEADAFKAADSGAKCAMVLQSAAQFCMEEHKVEPPDLIQVLLGFGTFLKDEFDKAMYEANKTRIIMPDELKLSGTKLDI